MRGMQASRQHAQRTTAKAGSAAEHRRLLRCFTRTIRAGETTQQTVCSGVAYAANARMLRCSRQRQEAGQWEGVASRRRAAFLCCMFQRIRRESYAAKAAFGVRARKLTKGLFGDAGDTQARGALPAPPGVGKIVKQNRGVFLKNGCTCTHYR